MWTGIGIGGWSRTLTKASKVGVALSNDNGLVLTACYASFRLLSPLAVRLWQLRAAARQDPERPACSVIDPLTLAVLAQRSGKSSATMTVGTFWTEVARLGGYLARSHDGPPGWRTIWKGWLSLQSLLEGVHLAFHLRL